MRTQKAGCAAGTARLPVVGFGGDVALEFDPRREHLERPRVSVAARGACDRYDADLSERRKR